MKMFDFFYIMYFLCFNAKIVNGKKLERIWILQTYSIKKNDSCFYKFIKYFCEVSNNENFLVVIISVLKTNIFF